MGHKILLLVLAAANAVLLCTISASAIKQNLPKRGETAANAVTETAAGPADTDLSLVSEDIDPEKMTFDLSDEIMGSPAETAAEKSDETTTEETASKTNVDMGRASDAKASDSSIPDGKNISIDLNAGIPDSEGFSWAAGIPSWVYMPESAVRIEDFSKITGGWKAYMVSDPENKRNSSCNDYFNINISGTEAASIVTFKWYIRTFNADMESIDVSGEDSVFSGRFKDSAIYATGAGNVDLTAFYYDDATGREYAVGTFMWPDGVEACIGLVRP